MLKQLMKPDKNEEIVVIHTNFGDIKIRLFPEVAPKAVENFVTHAKEGYYDGISFHRVISDFMIQGGDPEGTGRGGKSIWGKAFADEFHVDYRNFRGALAMANSGPNTNGSQFFIVQKREIESNIIRQMKDLGEKRGYSEEVVEAYQELGGTFWLDGKHTVFGQVFQGMDVVDAIAETQVGGGDKPINPVLIERLEILPWMSEENEA